MAPKLQNRGKQRHGAKNGPSLPSHYTTVPPATDSGAAAGAQYTTSTPVNVEPKSWADIIRTMRSTSSNTKDVAMSGQAQVEGISSPSILPFFLPKITFLDDPDDTGDPRLELEHRGHSEDFSLLRLAWAIQRKVNPQGIKTYLDQYGTAVIKSALGNGIHISDSEAEVPILYFAAEANSPDLVRMLCRAGADPDLCLIPLGTCSCLTVLSYTVLSAEYSLSDMTNTVLALLAMGACPTQIPMDLWEDYIATPKRDLPNVTMANMEGDDGGVVERCSTEVRHALCRTLNLMQRYALWKARHTPRPTPRQLQCAEPWEMLPLFEVPFHIIGQQRSTHLVQKSILSHRLFESTTPLVFLFTGPSGHGKTELARQMGDLLSLGILSIDCTEMREETDIFGPKAPYNGSAQGTPLNNHLAKYTGQRAVVFLDEYDKTTDAVRNSMLLLLDNGDYKDRRNHKQLDCSKIIWVLAANFGVEIITKFWTNNLKDRSMEQQNKAPWKSLEASLKAHIISKIGAPNTGRITEIVPFFPFNEDEQAVTAYKFMRQLWNTVRGPINTEIPWFPGHSYVNYIDDGRIATFLAKEGYNLDLGARSLQSAVVRHVQNGLADAFSEEVDEISDSMNHEPLTNYNVRVVTVGTDTHEVQVECNGTRSLQERPVETNMILPPTPVSPALSASSEL